MWGCRGFDSTYIILLIYQLPTYIHTYLEYLYHEYRHFGDYTRDLRGGWCDSNGHHLYRTVSNVYVGYVEVPTGSYVGRYTYYVPIYHYSFWSRCASANEP